MKNIVILLMILVTGLAFGPQLFACGGAGTGEMTDMSGHHGSGMGGPAMNSHSMPAHTAHHPQSQRQYEESLDVDQARALVEEHLRSTNNPNLMIGNIS
jgi:hypothetical protein